MDNMMIKNAQGEQLNINIVRYFRLNNVEYLVFSLNEVDEGGYVKLYISKINGKVANTITDDVEWNLIKDTIKTIIKANKDNLSLPITDLDVRRLNDIQIIGQKVFKLSETFIQLLGANKKVEAYVEPISPIIEPITPVMEEMDKFSLNSIQQNPIMDSFLTVEQPTITEPVFPQAEISPIAPITPVMENKLTEEIVSSVGEQSVDNLDNISSNDQDYKTLYENELNKNELLTAEVEKYRTIINNLKNIISESETL